MTNINMNDQLDYWFVFLTFKSWEDASWEDAQNKSKFRELIACL